MTSQSEANGAVCLNSQLPLFKALVPRGQLFAFFNGARLPMWSGSEEHLHHLKDAWEKVLAKRLANRADGQPGACLELPSGGLPVVATRDQRGQQNQHEQPGFRRDRIETCRHRVNGTLEQICVSLAAGLRAASCG